MIFELKNGQKYIFSLTRAYTPSAFLRGLIYHGPSRGLNNTVTLIANAQLSRQWKQALIKELPAEVIRQRTEVSFWRVALGGLALALIIIGSLAAYIWLWPHD
jgi:hypothetical protein